MVVRPDGPDIGDLSTKLDLLGDPIIVCQSLKIGPIRAGTVESQQPGATLPFVRSKDLDENVLSLESRVESGHARHLDDIATGPGDELAVREIDRIAHDAGAGQIGGELALGDAKVPLGDESDMLSLSGSRRAPRAAEPCWTDPDPRNCAGRSRCKAHQSC